VNEEIDGQLRRRAARRLGKSYTDRRGRNHLQARTRLKGRPPMSHKGVWHIGLSTLDLDRTRDFYENVLKFKAVRCDTLRVKEGGQIRHIFFDTGRDQLIAFMEARGVPGVPEQYDAGINGGLGVPNAFYHFAFEAGSEAGLDEMRNALIARSVEATEVVDNGWGTWTYIKDTKT